VVAREAEARLRGLMTLAEESAEGDLAQLTSVYENMKPKDASLLFERMSPDFAAGFLGRMRPDAAAAIMSGLPPELGYSISVLLAGRNAEAAAFVAGQ
jgi:flagellar motility protein MotE (MotC chaperone)